MRSNLCLSTLGVHSGLAARDNIIGIWCLNKQSKDYLAANHINYSVISSRKLNATEFREEATTCLNLYSCYVEILTKSLNKIHGLNYSKRFWETLLYPFMYQLVASVTDHYEVLKEIRNNYPDARAEILDINHQWLSPHKSIGGSSRLYHFYIYSLIVVNTRMFDYSTLPLETVAKAFEYFGDGKKGAASIKPEKPSFLVLFINKLYLIKRAMTGSLPIEYFKYTGSDVIALGDQYLGTPMIRRFMKAVSGKPYSVFAMPFAVENLAPCDTSTRQELEFPHPENVLEEVLQDAIRRLLPSIFLENFSKINSKIMKYVPKKKILFLDSLHCSGGERIDFFKANAVEHFSSEIMMICHGGCYGAMEITVQEQIWSRVSDYYALWSNPVNYNSNCTTLKLPSLRFHNKNNLFSNSKQGQDILVFLTGHYPNRYAYNSIFPYTLDDDYSEWQLRFLDCLDKDNYPALVLRDYHNSDKINDGKVLRWAEVNKIKIQNRLAFYDALSNSKLCIQTVPQTTYLETIIADKPTICYWNPESNFIREDLKQYFDEMYEAKVFHRSPESAADQVNLVSEAPLDWWNCGPVKEAVSLFRENVCLTSSDGFNRWEKTIKSIIGKSQ